MGPNRNPRWEQKRTEGYVIVSRLLALQKRLATPLACILKFRLQLKFSVYALEKNIAYVLYCFMLVTLGRSN